jgi:hypothetical protein
VDHHHPHPEELILAFDQDGSVTAYEDEHQVNSCCEWADVKRGRYLFLDDDGFLLQPQAAPAAPRKWFRLFTRNDAPRYSLVQSAQRRRDLLQQIVRGETKVCLGPSAVSQSELIEILQPPSPAQK